MLQCEPDDPLTLKILANSTSYWLQSLHTIILWQMTHILWCPWSTTARMCHRSMQIQRCQFVSLPIGPCGSLLPCVGSACSPGTKSWRLKSGQSPGPDSSRLVLPGAPDQMEQSRPWYKGTWHRVASSPVL